MKLTHLSDAELLSGIELALGSERVLLATTIAHLSEIEERRLHLRTAHSSLFDFCLRALKLSDGEAFRRITAARLFRRFPVVYELVESGAIHLSALVALRDYLTDDNHAELLDAARGKTKRQLEHLIAERFPLPDVPSRIRKLPERKAAAKAPIDGEKSGGTARAQPPQPEPRETAAVTAPSELSGPSSRVPPLVEPLSPSRYKVQFTASNEFREKLERARDLMSHANPSRDIAIVLDRAVDALLKDLERSKLKKTEHPQRNPRKSTTDRIPDHVRREVFERDGGRCTFEDDHGHRCEARAFLELDHIKPRALGGESVAANLRLRCRAHNLLEAERVFGKTYVSRKIHFRQEAPAKRAANFSPHPPDLSMQGATLRSEPAVVVPTGTVRERFDEA